MSKEQIERSRINASGRSLGIFIGQVTGLAFFAFLFALYLNLLDIFPRGTDVWGHVYKAQHMYNSIKSGSFYPIFDMYWYNGIETFRYWGPVSYYFYAIPLLITGGKTIISYRMFLSLMVFLGGIPWIIIGFDSNRKVLGFFSAIMWFMLPTNIHVLIAYGNVPQIGTIMLTPYLILFLRRYLINRENNAAIGLVLVMALMTSTHLMVTGITGLSVFIFLLIDSFFNKDYLRKFSALAYMVCGILIMGIWFFPALKGGMINSSDSGLSAAEVFVTDLSISLDPIRRFFLGWNDFYFGLSLVLISIFGIIASNKRNKAGFIFLIFIMLVSSPAAYKIISHIPMSGLFWMERFTPVAYALFLYSLIDWTSIKKKFLAIITILLVIDSVPFYAINLTNIMVTDSVVSDIDILNEKVTNRASLLELSSYGPYPSFEIPNAGHLYTFGWAWQGAITADNIMNVNEAFEAQKYLYMFDRSVELGDDTLLVSKYLVPTYKIEAMLEASEKSGYKLAETTDSAYIFTLNLPENTKAYGVISKYKGIAIGKYSMMFTTRYPAFCYGDSNFIDDYTFDELSSYETIFLSGFEYHDKAKAEKLLKDVSKEGTRVVIDAAKLPKDPKLNENYFLGVVGSRIQFENRYPALNYNGQVLYASDFSYENASFGTEYFSGTDNVIGYFNLDNTKIPFLGNNNDCPEIYFLGINMVYEAMDTEDEVLYQIIDDLMRIKRDELPDRRLVPIDVKFDNNSLTIVSPEDNVNTTISFAECFKSDKNLRGENNLLLVDQGTTNIYYQYSMLKESAIVSIVGLVLTIGWAVINKRFHI